jgi:hypothetical protein
MSDNFAYVNAMIKSQLDNEVGILAEIFVPVLLEDED